MPETRADWLEWYSLEEVLSWADVLPEPAEPSAALAAMADRTRLQDGHGFFRGDGTYPLRVAGLYHRREVAQSIARNADGTSAFIACCAFLVAEPENEHDKNAIRVEISGKKVGYVPASEALRFAEAGVRPVRIGCYATLVGGLVTEEKSYEYIVELDLAWPLVECAVPQGVGDLIMIARAPFVVQGPLATPGTRMRTCAWLPYQALGDIDKRWRTTVHTWEGWDTVNYTLRGKHRSGGGNKLFGIPKAFDLHLFGLEFPEFRVTGIEGRIVHVEFEVKGPLNSVEAIDVATHLLPGA